MAVTTRNLAYILNIRGGGETSSSVSRVFGNLNSELRETQSQIDATTDRQRNLLKFLDNTRRGVKSFDELDGELNDTQIELIATSDRQQELLKALENTSKGTEPYFELQREIRDTEKEIEDLTDAIKEQARIAEQEVQDLTDTMERQEKSWNRLGKAQNIARNSTLALGAALAGLGAGYLLVLDRQGEYAQQLLAIEKSTGISIDTVQRFQAAVRATGHELSTHEFQEFAVRIGDAFTGASADARNALELLGFRAEELYAEDLPKILNEIRKVDDYEVAATLVDRIFGETLGERLLPTLSLPDELWDQFNTMTVLTNETAEELALARTELSLFKDEITLAGANIVADFLPAMKGIADVMLPIISAFASWAEQNPAIIAGLLGAASAATVLAGATWTVITAYRILTTQTWLAAAARAAYGIAAQLSIPGVGIGLAAAAAAIVAGAGIALGVAASRSGGGGQDDAIEQALSDAEKATERGTRAAIRAPFIKDDVKEGVDESTLPEVIAFQDERIECLENILPTSSRDRQEIAAGGGPVVVPAGAAYIPQETYEEASTEPFFLTGSTPKEQPIPAEIIERETQALVDKVNADRGAIDKYFNPIGVATSSSGHQAVDPRIQNLNTLQEYGAVDQAFVDQQLVLIADQAAEQQRINDTLDMLAQFDAVGHARNQGDFPNRREERQAERRAAQEEERRQSASGFTADFSAQPTSIDNGVEINIGTINADNAEDAIEGAARAGHAARRRNNREVEK